MKSLTSAAVTVAVALCTEPCGVPAVFDGSDAPQQTSLKLPLPAPGIYLQLQVWMGGRGSAGLSEVCRQASVWVRHPPPSHPGTLNKENTISWVLRFSWRRVDSQEPERKPTGRLRPVLRRCSLARSCSVDLSRSCGWRAGGIVSTTEGPGPHYLGCLLMINPGPLSGPGR